MAQFSPSVLLLSEVHELPGCTWAELARAMNVTSPEKASQLLDKIAGKFWRSRVEGVPQPILHLAEFVHVNPYVAWMWTLSPDFFLPGEPKNREDPGEYYLLHVMREYCRDPMQKDMDELAVEIMGDRRRYSDVRGDGHRHGHRIVLAKMKTYGSLERELLKFMGDRTKNRGQ
jgi:hypothetical protein